MSVKNLKKSRRLRIRYRIRKRISGTEECPRFSVYKSNTSLYAQFIDDTRGHTILAGDTRKLEGSNAEKVTQLGKLLAEKAQEKKIARVVYDRSGYIFHGILKTLFDSFRETFNITITTK